MPRKMRQLSSSSIYHVLIQGYKLEPIFKTDSDKKFFISILLDNASQNNFELFAYCVMDNHAHLVIYDFKNKLSTLMRETAKRYANHLNKNYKRNGKVFHDRFKSESIENTENLTSILNFINNDPLTHNSVNYYKWINSIETSLASVNGVLNKLPQANNISNHKFINCNNMDINKTIQNETQAKIFIQNYLESKNKTLEAVKTNWELRFALVHELKEKSNLSIRKIAYLLDLTRGVVQNIK